MYLLDTNPCNHVIVANPHLLQKLADVELERVSINVVVQAELLYMAYHSQRIERNHIFVHAILSGIAIYSITRSVADYYGQIKAALMERFGPDERAKHRRFELRHLGFTDNDLWIAATALRFNLTVVTRDGDFARIAEVTPLRHES